MAKEELKSVKTAENAGNKTVEEQEQAVKKEGRPVQEAVYPVKELVANAKIFNTRQEVVMAALKAAGKMEYSVSGAKEIVEKFLKREVR